MVNDEPLKLRQAVAIGLISAVIGVVIASVWASSEYKRSEIDDLRERAADITKQLEAIRSYQREIELGLGAITDRLGVDVERSKAIAEGIERIEAANRRIGDQLIAISNRVGSIEAGIIESREIIDSNLDILRGIQDRGAIEDQGP